MFIRTHLTTSSSLKMIGMVIAPSVFIGEVSLSLGFAARSSSVLRASARRILPLRCSQIARKIRLDM